MAKRTVEELLATIDTFLTDDNRLSDAALALREDINDSVAVDTGEDWKSKYEENDRQWRERYAARFRGADPAGDVAIVPDEPEPEHVTEMSDYEDLFENKEV